jgi:hypothetical protein
MYNTVASHADSPATMNPAQLLSFNYLAGSENPQPIDPHLLLGGNDYSVPSFTASTASMPTVKQEDVDSSFPISNQAQQPIATSTTTSNHSLPLRANSNAHHDSEDENDVMDGMQDDQDDDSDDSEEEEEEEAMPALKRSTRGGGAAAANSKKRTSVSKSASTSKKNTSQQSRKESSVLSSTGTHGQQQHPHALVPVPEYEDRPSKAEYDKLSSKEKRQMRNKISARNFRHRRKAHIDTLEALVADKEGIIDVLQEEVGTLRVGFKRSR